MKTARKIITISFLTIAIILLIAFGIKTNKLNRNKTTTPKIQHRSALRVDAEELYPISTKWIIDKSISGTDYFGQNINFTSRPNNSTLLSNEYTRISYTYPNNWTDRITYTATNQVIAWERYESTRTWNDSGYRIVDFEEEPNGTLYTWLNNHARPCYNNDVLLVSDRTYSGWSQTTQPEVINEIRKSSLTIDSTSYLNGTMINETGTIQIFLDAGTSQLLINGTDYTSNLNGSVNITNNDIVISTYGTRSGNTSYVFTINYFNTRPPIEPQPYPDPGQKVTEVLDITGLMFEILTMPFSFITQAFNVTLWEGTPYQFNFSNFILSLIAIATLIFIIKLFTSGFAVISNYTASRDNREFKRSQTRLNNAKTQQIKDNKPQIKHTYVHKDKD